MSSVYVCVLVSPVDPILDRAAGQVVERLEIFCPCWIPVVLHNNSLFKQFRDSVSEAVSIRWPWALHLQWDQPTQISSKP